MLLRYPRIEKLPTNRLPTNLRNTGNHSEQIKNMYALWPACYPTELFVRAPSNQDLEIKRALTKKTIANKGSPGPWPPNCGEGMPGSTGARRPKLFFAFPRKASLSLLRAGIRASARRVRTNPFRRSGENAVSQLVFASQLSEQPMIEASPSPAPSAPVCEFGRARQFRKHIEVIFEELDDNVQEPRAGP